MFFPAKMIIPLLLSYCARLKSGTLGTGKQCQKDCNSFCKQQLQKSMLCLKYGSYPSMLIQINHTFREVTLLHFVDLIVIECYTVTALSMVNMWQSIKLRDCFSCLAKAMVFLQKKKRKSITQF